MRRSIDDATDDHPADDDERPPVSWAVALSDDCDACGMGEPRVVLTLEEVGAAGLGLVAHLAPATARRLRTAIAAALREIGEDPGPIGWRHDLRRRQLAAGFPAPTRSGGGDLGRGGRGLGGVPPAALLRAGRYGPRWLCVVAG